MRHRCSPRKLNITDGAHRRAMMRHICNALIVHEQINTTLPRAKELRRLIEPLITMGKVPSVHRRRLAFARLLDRDCVKKLFDDLGVRFSARPGGYVRILKNGYRKGDSAPMALVEFVDKAPVLTEAAEAAKLSAKPSAKKLAAKKSAAKKSAKSRKAQKATAKASGVADAAKTAESAKTQSAKTAESAKGIVAKAAPDGKDAAAKSATVAKDSTKSATAEDKPAEKQ